ncbi:hypothetical protein BV326_01246 [Pseudomonas syringae pv. actinidiae]|nr:hypothetical protein BV326_01246 [Pseudomonas syringae pv. actinidiae]
MSKPFVGYLKPVNGETLSSWLFRNSCSPHVRNVHSAFLKHCSDIAREETNGDLGNLVDAESFRQLFPLPMQGLLQDVFPSSAPRQTGQARLVRHERVVSHYCSRCLAEDVMALRSPARRCEWDDTHVCICDRHPTLWLLQPITARNSGRFEREWAAFSSHTSGGIFRAGRNLLAVHNTVESRNPGEQIICRLILRVQKWVRGAPEASSELRLSRSGINFYLSFLLYRKFSMAKGGLAGWLVESHMKSGQASISFRPPTKSEVLDNIGAAPASQLAVAYLIIGISEGLFSAKEVASIAKAYRHLRYEFPLNRVAIADMARCLLVKNLNEFHRYACKDLPAADVNRLSWLFYWATRG